MMAQVDVVVDRNEDSGEAIDDQLSMEIQAPPHQIAFPSDAFAKGDKTVSPLPEKSIHSVTDHRETIDIPKPAFDRHPHQIALPSDVFLKDHDVSPLRESSSHSYTKGDRTLGTATETFSVTSEENTLLSSSQAEEGDSFYESAECSDSNYQASVEDLTSSSPSETPRIKTRAWPTNFYRAETQYNPPLHGKRPIPSLQSLFTTSSSDSWDERNGAPQEISLLDLESRDDDEEDEEESGHEGDDERDANVDEMWRKTMQFQQSATPAKSFRGALPRFSQGGLSHLEKQPERKWMPDLSFQSSSSVSCTSPLILHESKLQYLSSGEQSKETATDQISVTTQKGLIQSLKDIILCVPRVWGNSK